MITMKTTFVQIVKKLEFFCPKHLAMAGDSLGVQIKTKQKIIERIILALDPSLRVINKAKTKQCQLLITHHPLFWPNKKEGEINLLQERKKTLLEKAEINHYNLHTNYDQKYLNFLLVKKCFAKQGKITIFSGYAWLEMNNFYDWKIFLEILVKKLKLKGCQYWKSSQLKKIKTAVFVSGAGGFILEKKWKKQPDVIVTGEIKWNQWILAKDYKQSIITIGHHLEEFFIIDIKKRLQKWFPEIIIFEHWEKEINYHHLKDKKTLLIKEKNK